MDTALVWSGNGKIYFFKGKALVFGILIRCLLISIIWLEQGANIGDSTHNKNRPSNQPTRKTFPTGKVYRTISMPHSNLPTATVISSNTANIGGSTTAVLRYELIVAH